MGISLQTSVRKQATRTARRRTGTALAVVPLLFLAGCLGASSDAPRDLEAPLAPASLPSYRLECPPGETLRRGDVCVRTIASPVESYQELTLAIDPTDPSRMAISANAMGVRASSPADPAGWGPYGARGVVFVTEDGGATWRDAAFPAFPHGPHQQAEAGDLRLAFGADGTLHVIGMGFTYGHTPLVLPAYTGGILYSSTRDFRTWTAPVYAGGEADTDFPMMATGGASGVAVGWYEPRAGHWGVGFARSLDNGATWDRVHRECWVSQPLFVQEDVWMGCPIVTLVDGAWNGTGVHVLRWAADAVEPEIVATLPWHGIDRMDLYRHEGRFLAVVLTLDNRILTTWSADGIAWSEFADPLAAVSLDDPEPRPHFHGAALDPHGVLHVVMAWSECVRNNVVWTCPVHGKLHFAWDPEGERLLGEEVLAPRGGPVPRRSPPVLEPGLGWGDDYSGVAFTAEFGFLAWSLDRGIDLARVAIEPATG